MNQREKYFTIATPMPGLEVVVLYKDTVNIHIGLERRLPGFAQVVIASLESPSVVLKGTTNESYLVFVNQSERSPSSNSPFAVIVDPQSQPPAVASFGYRRDFRNLANNEIVWPPPKVD